MKRNRVDKGRYQPTPDEAYKKLAQDALISLRQLLSQPEYTAWQQELEHEFDQPFDQIPWRHRYVCAAVKLARQIK